MAIEIIVQTDNENPFLERREIKFTVTTEGATPKESDVRTSLAEKLKVPDKNILIEHIYQKMGLHESECTAKVYKKSLVAEKDDKAAEAVSSDEKKEDSKEDEKKVEEPATKEEKKE